MSLGQAARNVVRIGKKLVVRYEKKSCTTADKAKKQKAAASTGTLVGASVLDLLWNSGKAAVVGTGARAAASPYVVVGGIVFLTVWWMNPIEAGESEEDVKRRRRSGKKLRRVRELVTLKQKKKLRILERVMKRLSPVTSLTKIIRR